MHGRFRVLTGALVAGALAASTAWAQSAPPKPLFSMAVTEAVDVVELAGTTRRIGRAEIERAQARTLDEALRLVPGIFVRVGAEGVPRVDLRGLRARHVLLLIDGIPLTSTDDGQFDPSRIPATFIREIKVTYGSSSVLYGENAMAGAIEILTDAAVGRGLHGELEADLREGGQRTIGARMAGGSDRVAFFVAGDAFARDGFPLPGRFRPTPLEDGGLRENSDADRSTVLAKVNARATASLKVSALFSAGTGSYGAPPATIDDPGDAFAQRARYERVEPYHTLAGQISFGYLPASAFSLRGWGFVNQQTEDRARYDDETYTSMDDPSVSGTFRRDDRTRVTGGALHGGRDMGRAGRLRIALNGRRERYTTDGIIRDVASGGGSGGGGGQGRGSGARTFGLRTFDERHHVDVYSAAAEWEFRAARNTWIVLGLGRNWQDRARTATATGTSWSAGATHGLAGGVGLRASVSSRVRFPSIRQLYEEGTGNAALAPERSLAVEAGLDKRWGGRADTGMTVFWMRADDFIERLDTTARFENNERYRFAGLEATLRLHLSSPLDVWTRYSFLDARDRSPGSPRDALQNRPRHRLTVQPRWALPGGFAALAVLQYVADQVYYSRAVPLRTGRAGDYVLLDVALVKTFARRHEISAGVENVFDELYEDGYALPQAGRTARVRFRARF